MKVPHSWTVVAEVGVDTVGIEQTVGEQLEHGTSQEDRNRLTHASQQVAGR
jgi:hypothetical protein